MPSNENHLSTSQALNEASEHPPFWEFVHPEDYELPTEHIQKATVSAWRLFKKRLKDEDPSQTLFKAEKDLHSLSEVRLAHFVPSVPWHEVAANLDKTWHDWPDKKASQTQTSAVKFVVGQPFSGHAHIVSIFGKRRHARILTPPTYQQILHNEQAWFEEIKSLNEFWVLPNLERCFLRHANGLNFVRQFLSKAANGDFGHGVIACDSWAWEFLKRTFTWPANEVLTLQAFNAERLTSLLTNFAKQSHMHLCYLQAKNGQQVVGDAVNMEQQKEEFTALAAHCRRNFALALSYWQNRLYDELFDAVKEDPPSEVPEADQSASDDKQFTQKSPKTASSKTLWVANMPSEPSLPFGNQEAYFLVLHALLLHGGLSQIYLEQVLPYSLTRCQALLAQLAQSNLVQCTDQCWYLKPTAYITVRRLLVAQHYLTDRF